MDRYWRHCKGSVKCTERVCTQYGSSCRLQAGLSVRGWPQHFDNVNSCLAVAAPLAFLGLPAYCTAGEVESTQYHEPRLKLPPPPPTQDEAPEKYQTHFKAWIDAGLDPDGIEDLYKEVCTGIIP